VKKRLEEILEQVHAGKITPAKALELLEDYPYCDLDFAKVDHHREVLKGAPEIVFGLGKTPAQIGSIAREILKKGSNLLVTRVAPEAWAKIKAKLPGAVYNEAARTVSLEQSKPPAGRGTVIILTAGTSDIPSGSTTSASPASTGSSVSSTGSAGPGSSSPWPAWRGPCRASSPDWSRSL
jgi:NCAIR mutase (PurE)-related protein